MVRSWGGEDAGEIGRCGKDDDLKELHSRCLFWEICVVDLWNIGETCSSTYEWKSVTLDRKRW